MAKSEQKKTSASNGKVFDVHKPGSSAPDASSKPVIVGHKNILKDPMVKAGEEQPSVVEKSEEKTETTEQIISNTAPTLQPLNDVEADKIEESDKKEEETVPEANTASEEPEASESVEEEQQDVASTDETDSKPQADDAEEKPKQEENVPEDDKKEENTEDAESDESSHGNDEAEVAAVAEQVEQQKIDIKKQKVDEEKHAAMEKLAEAKKYYVPIGEKKHKRSVFRIILLLLLVLMLSALLFDVLIDAGFIDVNIDPPIKIINS